MKKILTIVVLVAIAAILSVVPMAFAAATEEITATIPSYDTATKTITITSEAEFLWISAYSNGKETTIDEIPATFSRWTINITAMELDFEGMSWEPIADFHGIINGTVAEDGATTIISKLNVSVEKGAGLCGNISFNEGLGQPQFNNLTIANSSFVASGAYAGAFAGNGYTAKFNNCHVVDTQVVGLQYVGGLVGSTYGSITNCSVSSSSNSIATSVKVVSKNYTIYSDDGDNVGGIVGFVGEGGAVISGCTVSYVEVEAGRQVGGIAGGIQYGNTVTDCVVSNCAVSSIATGSVIWATAAPSIGGIVGEARGSSGGAVITVTNNTVENTSITKAATTSFLNKNDYCGWVIGNALGVTTDFGLVCSGNDWTNNANLGEWNQIGN